MMKAEMLNTVSVLGITKVQDIVRRGVEFKGQSYGLSGVKRPEQSPKARSVVEA